MSLCHLFLAALLAAGCGEAGPPHPPPPVVLARVDTAAITAADFEQAVARIDVSGDDRTLEQWRRRLQLLIDRQLLVMEARRRGFHDDPRVLAGVAQWRRSRLLRSLIDREAGARLPGEEEVRDFFPPFRGGPRGAGRPPGDLRPRPRRGGARPRPQGGHRLRGVAGPVRKRRPRRGPRAAALAESPVGERTPSADAAGLGTGSRRADPRGGGIHPVRGGGRARPRRSRNAASRRSGPWPAAAGKKPAGRSSTGSPGNTMQP